MENKNSEAKPAKRNLWALIKESMNKASSGCGPGCGCHVVEPGNKSRKNESPADSGKDNQQA